jgi:hypothetical protein
MSWPPDAPQPDADSLPESHLSSQTSNAEAPETEAPIIDTEAAPAKPPRRRRTPRARAEAVPDASTTPDVEVEAPVVETQAAPEPVRRRGRRKAVAEETPTPDPVASTVPPAPTRRRGQRRIVEPVVVELPITVQPITGIPAPPDASAGLVQGISSLEETPTLAETADETLPTTPGRRRGRRRGTQSEPVPAVATPPDSSLTDKPAEAVEATSEETETKKRRPRRRRRRGQDDNVSDSVEMTETGDLTSEIISVEPAEQEESIFYLPPPPPMVYAAPPLVPLAQAPHAGTPLPRTSAAVRHGSGLPQIATDSQTHAPYLFFVNTETAESSEVVNSQIREVAAAGIHLYSGVMYLPLRNAYGDRSFAFADALVQQVLAADPDGFLLPRLQFVPTNYWMRTHTDQAARYAGGEDSDVSLASTEFWADCVDALESLIAHFADPNTPGGDRVIGFHLDRGEWFHDPLSGPDLSEPNREAFRHWLHAKYQAPYALRAAWYDGQVTFDNAEIPTSPARAPKNETKRGNLPLLAGARDGCRVDYALFSSEIVARIITGLAAAVKTLSANRLLVSVSYGYTLEFSSRSDSGHLALGTVLASPDIDIVAGPNSYNTRSAGSTGAFGSPIDSVALHGKLWLVEDDTKTFLAPADSPDTYNPHIVSGMDTQAAHQRHFGAALAHNAGMTWMDLWGQGWLDSPDIWHELGGLRDLAAVRGQITPSPQPPDVAMLVDEASLAYLKSDSNSLGQNLVVKTRDLLLRAGVSVGFYLQSDVTHEDFPDAKLYIFVNALRVTTTERQAIRERLQRPGKTLVWLYAPALFDEKGLATSESSEVVGMALRLQSWNARGGSQITEAKHPITERLRTIRRLGQEEVLNPSYAVSDPQATVLAEYTGSGSASLAVREHPSGWKTVFVGDPHLSMELLRGLFAYAGVHVYDTQDDIVYASEGVLLIHAPTSGQRTLTLPRKALVYDVLENTLIAADTRTFRTNLRARTTRLFLWGDRAAVLAATGLPLPAGAAALEPEAPLLPPPPAFPISVSPPLSEPAFEIAARYERTHPEIPSAGDVTLEVSDLTAVLEMEDGEIQDEESESEETTTEEPTRPRSRWQRRRAAARARRDAERSAQAQAIGTAETGLPNPPVDISALLPDLPPRLKMPGIDTSEAKSEEGE